MLKVFKEMVLTLRSMDHVVTDDDANETWRAHGKELTEEILYLANDLFLERRTWAVPPTLIESVRDAIKIHKEGNDGTRTEGIKAEESGVQDGGVNRESSPPDAGGREQPEGLGNSGVPKGHDKSDRPCCRSGLIFARRKEADGSVSQDYVFKCSCLLGARFTAIYPTWMSQRDFIREP